VSTRILFADDSVTAQNMGKRILTEAGYEVVAVSNGAAAVKKIAEQKPDIIILDLYMPGYSGLEVCEKVRGSMATLKTPVLLTVGKMEPYRPEDANRVRADGVIVKPFEASDLLAIIRKFEERIAPPPPPLAPQPVVVEPEEKMAELEDLPPEASEPAASTSQPMLDVPDHMASSSAFADLLGMEPSADAPASVQPSVAYESSVESVPSRASVPEYELPISWRSEEQIQEAEIEVPSSLAPVVEPPQHDVQVFETGNAQHQAAHREMTDVAPPPVPSRPLQIPVYQESAEAEGSHEMMPTAAAPIGEIEIPRDPYLQEDASEATRNTVATSTEPGLVSTLQPDPEPPLQVAVEAANVAPEDSKFSISDPREMPAAASAGTTQEPAQPSIAHQQTPFSDTDFEARVAAALATYTQTETTSPVASAEPASPAPEHQQSATLPAYEIEQPSPLEANTEAFEERAHSTSVEQEPVVSAEPDQAVSAFEYHPPIGVSLSEGDASQSLPSSSAAGAGFAMAREHEPVSAHDTLPAEHSQETHANILQSDGSPSAEAVPQALAAAAAAESPANRDTIALAVYRAMERMRPELVEEILRELKSKE
jgi:CheY-like chemotaxis protein